MNHSGSADLKGQQSRMSGQWEMKTSVENEEYLKTELGCTSGMTIEMI